MKALDNFGQKDIKTPNIQGLLRILDEVLSAYDWDFKNKFELIFSSTANNSLQHELSMKVEKYYSTSAVTRKIERNDCVTYDYGDSENGFCIRTTLTVNSLETSYFMEKFIEKHDGILCHVYIHDANQLTRYLKKFENMIQEMKNM